MRVGRNPERQLNKKNKSYKHRIIVVYYIPDLHSDYFKESDLVLDKCLCTLINSINTEQTAITLINNNSCKESDWVYKKYQNQIDKYVFYNENKGKVYAVINEVRGIFEDFVTITDSDILFFNGWEKAVFDIFRNIPNAGAVSPCPLPYYTFYFNQSVFGLNSAKLNIGYGSILDNIDIDLYSKGTSLPHIEQRDGFKHNWRSKQFYIKKPFKAILGSFHVVTTYRTEQFRGIYNFPEMKFNDFYERDFMDCLSDEYGWYKLSTTSTHAYHTGNRLDDTYEHFKHKLSNDVVEDFENIPIIKPRHKILIFINRIVGRIFIKFYWNKKKKKYIPIN